MYDGGTHISSSKHTFYIITPELGPVGFWSPKSSSFTNSDSIVVEEAARNFQSPWPSINKSCAVADLEILSWGGQILIYFLIVVVLCYYYLGVELTESSTGIGTEKKWQTG